MTRNFDEVEIPETCRDSPQSQTPSELEMVKIHLVTKEVEEFLTILHGLLVKRRYDFLRGALLLALRAELESRVAPKQVIDLESIKEAFSVFLTLDKQEVQEMGAVAYLAGHEAKIVDDIPLQEQAESFIEALGLQELMEFNLSFGEAGTTRES